jgi:hypothetical protein
MQSAINKKTFFIFFISYLLSLFQSLSAAKLRIIIEKASHLLDYFHAAFSKPPRNSKAGLQVTIPRTTKMLILALSLFVERVVLPVCDNHMIQEVDVHNLTGREQQHPLAMPRTMWRGSGCLSRIYPLCLKPISRVTRKMPPLSRRLATTSAVLSTSSRANTATLAPSIG